jgi:hypothetical protein
MSDREPTYDGMQDLIEFSRDLPKLGRPDDWANLGAHRFAVASREMGALADRLEVYVQQIGTLLHQMPQFTHAVQTRIEQEGGRQANAIATAVRQQLAFAERTIARIEDSTAFLQAKADELLRLRRAVERDSSALERERCDLERRKADLAKQRAAFVRMSTWQRITAGRRWSWQRFAFVPGQGSTIRASK